MTRNDIEVLATEIRWADTWTEELLGKLYELAEEAGIDSRAFAEAYELCKAVQTALGVDLGE